MKVFCDRVRQARLNAGLSQEEAARLIGYSLEGYCRKERGKRTIYIEDVILFCAVFKTTPDYFFEGLLID